MDTPGRRLDSWKEIANYLGRDRTTVMRWERTASLPVHRVQGEKGRSVFAYTTEIDRWLREQSSLPAPSDTATPPLSSQRRWRTSLAWTAIVLVAAGAALAGIRAWTGAAPSSAQLIGEEIVAFDAGGREVWRHRLPHIDGNTVPARFLITDVDQDDRAEVIAAVHAMPRGGRGRGTLIVFDSGGSVEWERTVDDTYHFGADAFGPTWYPTDVAVLRSGSGVRLAVAYHHQTWWPSVVVTYDIDGRERSRFVNAGWVQSLTPTADGRHLLAAGISNAFGGAMLAVLDADDPAGSSPSADGSLAACGNCPPGAPVAYFVAPWTELGRPSDTPAVLAQTLPSGEIEWHAVQRAPAGGKAPAVIINVSPQLDVVRSAVNNYFVETHAELERSGLLRANDRWREPPVRVWTAQAGWREAIPR